ncbi:D-glycerate dehydrogenase [bacterium]|nr:D-glycerate dehydrogenase [bacterium]
MKEVFITRIIPEAGIKLLESAGIKTVVNYRDSSLNQQEIIEQSENADAILCLLSDKFDSTLISGLKKVKVIANYAVGYNNIDVECCMENNIYVTNTPGVLTDTTADLGFALLMATARKIPQAHLYTKSGKFNGWGAELMLGHDIHGKKLGIVGLGRIGQAIAKRANGFDMDISYYSRTRKSELESEKGYKFKTLQALAKESDFIILCCSLTDETHHLINEDILALMKSSAYIINLSRGQVINEKHLIDFLSSGKIAGAGLDVYEHEPNFSPKLTKLENIVLLPHIGSASIETRNIMAELAARNIIDVLIDEKIPRSNVY